MPSRRALPRRRSAAMFELMLCSMFTLLPDYLYRRYGQGKRIGKEITLFSMWYELRWGITGCVMLTVLLITMIFYFHPSTTSAALFFRTVPIVPEGSGPRRGGQGRLQRAGQEGRRAVHARQLEAEGRRRNRQAQDRRGRRPTRQREGRRGQGGSPDPAGQQRLQAGQGRTGREERTAAAQSRHRAAA